jgi:hypothetical protein
MAAILNGGGGYWTQFWKGKAEIDKEYLFLVMTTILNGGWGIILKGDHQWTIQTNIG